MSSNSVIQFDQNRDCPDDDDEDDDDGGAETISDVTPASPILRERRPMVLPTAFL